MTANVMVMGREELTIFRISHPHLKNIAFISISDVGVPPLQFKEDEKFLTLQFNDEDWDDLTEEKLNKGIMFSERQAKKILDFVNKHKNNVDFFIVNCHAGISRSGAVGLWLVRYLGNSEEEFFKKHPKVMPNQYVLNILEKIQRNFS